MSMAIIEPHSLGAPLSQGDILKGIRLFLTRKSPDSEDYISSEAKFGLCLVLSRQCVVEHKRSLVVVGVMKYSGDVSPDLTFQEVVDFLETARDGVNTPDQFYLGHLPSLQGRYCARLDSLHTIELPSKPEDRQAFIDTHRIARLNKDFIRDLHLRVHQAFANMGFEDYQWLSDGDLELLVEKGNSEIRKIEEDQRMATLTRESSGNPADSKQINKDRNTLITIRKRVEPFANELARRRGLEPQVTEAGVEQVG
jgi:hypothetical protein